MKRLAYLLAILVTSLAANAEKYISVDKPSLRLYLIEDNDTILSFPVCAGENLGQKRRSGDHKTPEGTFSISMIQDSSRWYRVGSYGPWFFRLRTPMSTHIGIHGTDEPESIGTRASEGCIRLHNEDLVKLKPHVFRGMKVIISPDPVIGPKKD